MGSVREFVRAKLAGFHERQEERDAARAAKLLLAKVYRARREGSLRRLPWAIEWLTVEDAKFWVEDQYGVSLLYVAGICLAYRPDGTYDGIHRSNVGLQKSAKDPRQGGLFSDETIASFSV